MSEPSGLGVGTGAQDSTELFVDWNAGMPMVPSKYDVVRSIDFRGHQETLNAQFSAVGSYGDIRNGVN